MAPPRRTEAVDVSGELRVLLVGAGRAGLVHGRNFAAGVSGARLVGIADPLENDRLMASLPVGSLVVNGTGMGKDSPGSPITDDALFPEQGLVWEFNYRGELDFLHQARRQEQARGLVVEDGWRYFIQGWTSVIEEVFDVAITPDVLDGLSEIAIGYQ